MDIQKLIQLRTIVDTGGLNRAAKLLHLTQGALSKSIKTLENEWERPLFRRDGRRMVLTEFGKKVYSRSARLLLEYERFVSNSEDAEEEEVLRFASVELFTSYVLGSVCAKDPSLSQATWRVLDIGIGEIERAVRGGEVDFGVTYLPVPHESLEFDKLARFRFGIFGPAPFREIESNADYPFAAPVMRTQLNSEAITSVDSWPELVPRRVKYRLTSLESALELARKGLCAIHLPNFVVSEHNTRVPKRLQLVPLRAPKGYRQNPLTAYLVRRRGEELNPQVRAFARTLRSVIQG